MRKNLCCIFTGSLVVLLCGGALVHSPNLLAAADENSVEATEVTETAKAADTTDVTEESTEDPLAGEDPVATRITADANRLNGLIDVESIDVTIPLSRLLNASGSVSDAERLEAAATLRGIIEQLDSTNARHRSAARQLKRRVELAEAAVKAMSEAGVSEETRKAVDELLVRATVDWESDCRRTHSDIVRNLYRRLRIDAPPVYNAIARAFVRDFCNYNVHFVISEPMLSRIMSDQRTEAGDVADCILGAWVTGCQVTDTSLQTDIKPSRGSARFNLIVHGCTSTDTRGRKSPATIYSRGNHSFTVLKPTYFDGEQIYASPASIDVKMNTRTVGVSTDYDGIPILGGIARKIAYRRAEEQKPQANAIAARKLANRVLPRFEGEVGDEFAKANSNFRDELLANLERRGIRPDVFNARSTESHIAVSSRTLAADTLAAPRPPVTPAPSRGMSIQIHQSTVNAAIDALNISGQLKPSQVIDRIEDGLNELLNRDIRIDRSNVDDETTFDFSQFDPIRVRFEDGAVVVILRTGFIQPNRTVAKHRLEIALPVSVNGGQIQIETPTIKGGGARWTSRPIEEGSRATARVVIGQLIRKTFPEPVITRDATHELELPNGRTLSLQATKIDVADGWLTVEMQ